MIRFIPMLMLMGVFAAVGIYWTILTEHFIAWTRKYQDSFTAFGGGHSAQPVLVNQARADLAEVRSSSTALTWGVRMVGIALSGTALMTIIRIILGI